MVTASLPSPSFLSSPFAVVLKPPVTPDCRYVLGSCVPLFWKLEVTENEGGCNKVCKRRKEKARESASRKEEERKRTRRALAFHLCTYHGTQWKENRTQHTQRVRADEQRQRWGRWRSGKTCRDLTGHCGCACVRACAFVCVRVCMYTLRCTCTCAVVLHTTSKSSMLCSNTSTASTAPSNWSPVCARCNQLSLSSEGGELGEEDEEAKRTRAPIVVDNCCF